MTALYVKNGTLRPLHLQLPRNGKYTGPVMQPGTQIKLECEDVPSVRAWLGKYGVQDSPDPFHGFGSPTHVIKVDAFVPKG